MNKTATIPTPPKVSFACHIVGVTPLNTETFQVELEAPADVEVGYVAGQYLELGLDLHLHDGEPSSPLFYSIANGFDPARPQRLELFIQNISDSAAKVVDHLTQCCETKAQVTVTLPMGQAFLQTDVNLMHVLIASGSGISQIKCIAEEIFRRKPDAAVKVYWSNKSPEDFYLLDQFSGWSDAEQGFNFTPLLESAHADWSGRTGYIYQIIKEDFDSLEGAQVYLCGSPRMVYGTIDKLTAIGLEEGNSYSDVFEYAPRAAM